ncbi:MULTISPECIES: hypothetical protein [Sphingomonas]|uniref:hypothetical protein n=1 Tax=Sphingomonas TaxID=13687 RepID=UPI001269C682|nr:MULTISPECIES: hypothetical protein [Sphingomonas]
MATPEPTQSAANLLMGLKAQDQRSAIIEVKIGALDKRLDEQNEAYARVEILLGVFGVLLTLLVIYLGWRVEQSAIRAATGVAKDDLKDSKEEIENCVTESKQALKDTQRILLQIEGHKVVAAQDVEKIRQYKINVSEANPKKRPS